MNIRLKPISVQIAVIFGASSGIGRLTAMEFAKRGAKLCVAARSEEGLKSLAAEIEADGGEAFYVIADVADFEQVKNVADKCCERYGRLDTWIHSAATFIFATVEKTEPKEYKRLLEVNLLGQIHGAKAALPHLREKGGALIHVGSAEAWRTAPYQSAYGASKHGLRGFLQVLRAEIEHDQVPVSVTQILPAAINTPIYEKGFNKMPFKMRPVPPIYHPQIVVDTILYAAENPVTDIVAGGAGAGVIFAERLSPTLADWISGKVGFIGEKIDEPNINQRRNNLFEPIAGFDTVEGQFSDEQFRSDPYTWLATHKKVKKSLLSIVGIVGGLLAWKAIKGKKNFDL